MHKVVLNKSVTVAGKVWELFSYEFDSPDGRFIGYIYAISYEHAAELLLDLKNSARISGKIE